MKINKFSTESGRNAAMMNRLKQVGALALCAMGACVLFQASSDEADNNKASLALNQKANTRRRLNKVSGKHNVLSKKDIEFTPHKRRQLLSSEVVSSIGDATSNGHWSNSHNVVHVVNTRFLQHQSKLVHLQTARLDLFQTFTLPSLRQQTNQEFLWMIWTDEEETSFQKELIQLLANVPNAVLVGLSQEKEATFRELYGHTWTAASAAVKAGDHQRLADYYKASQTHLLLETRLDADDALSQTFVESLQAQAAAAMGDNKVSGAMEMYCPESHVEWRYYSEENAEDEGKLVHFHDEDFCIFSGLTTASNPGERRSSTTGRLLQVNNNGQNCPFPGGNNNCPKRRKLDALFEQDVVQQARPRGRKLSRCDEVDIACYGCGSNLECIATDYGRDITPVMDFIMAGMMAPDSGSFCEWNPIAGMATTCAGQPCGSLSAWTKTDLTPPGTCPYIGETICPNDGSHTASTFATYQAIYCFNGADHTYDVMLNTCHDHCTSGKCSCAYGGYSFCSACYKDDDDDDCRRMLKVLPRDDEAEESSVYKSAPAASVLLARTPTAAGMKNVIPNQKGGGENSIALATFDNVAEKATWQEMEREFGVSQESVTHLRERFEQDMENILIDAFAGQCTPGHSCKESTKRQLSTLLDKVQHRKA